MGEIHNISANAEGPDPQNRVSDPLVSARVKVEILSKLDNIRADKQTLHDEWGACFDCWDQKHRVRLYEGASDLFIPVARNIVETFVSQVKANIFPTTHRFYVEASPGAPGASPQAIGALLRHFAEQAHIEQHIEAFIRSGLIYGTAIAKFPWIERRYDVFRRQPLIPPEMAPFVTPDLAAAMRVTKESVKSYDGPAFRTVDLFRFYVYPITAPDVESATLLFEDIDVSWSHLKAMERAGVYADVDRCKDRIHPGNQSDGDRNQRLGRYNVNVEAARTMAPTARGKGDHYVITEIWAMFDIDGTGYEEPCKIVACHDVILEIRKNPFWSSRPPYRVWRLIDFPDLFFGQGLMTGLKHQNYAVNALVNQGIDAAVYQSNPIVIANSNALTQGLGSIKLGHRSVIYTNERPGDAVEFVKIPDTSPTAFQTASLIMQSMRDMAGAPPILQGKLGSRDTTATESSIIGANAQSGVQSLTSSLEASVLSPMLYDWRVLAQQFLDEEVWLKVTNEPKPVGISAQDIVGDYYTRWLVSGQVKQEAGAIQEEAVMNQARILRGGGAAGPMGMETGAEMGGQPLVPPGLGRA